jgi:presenilin-like A22 family membrane protease
MNKKLVLQLIAIFLVTQILGLYVGMNIISSGLEREGIVNSNPDDPINSIGLFIYILVFTGILLIILKFYKGEWLFRILEAILVFMTSLLVFAFVLPQEMEILALVLPAILVASKLFSGKIFG